MSQLMCTPEPQQCIDPSIRQESSSQSQSAQSQSKNNTSNSQKQEEMSSAGKNLPSAKLDLSNVPVINTIIPSPSATIKTSLSLGGSITAKPAGSSNPGTISNTGVSVDGKNGSASAGADGSVSAGLERELNGIKNSINIGLNNGKPTVSFGAAGSFGAVKTEVNGNTITFTCTSQDIKRTVRGVDLTGNISYSLAVTVIPNPPAPWYQQVYDTVANGLRSIGDAMWDNKEVILVGTVAVVVVGAVIMTGGAAAPALALTSDRRKKKNIRLVGYSPNGIPKYTFQYRDDERYYHGVMAQDLVETYPKALILGSDGFFQVDYSQLDVLFYEMP